MFPLIKQHGDQLHLLLSAASWPEAGRSHSFAVPRSPMSRSDAVLTLDSYDLHSKRPPAQHIGIHCRKAKEMGKPLEVAVVSGATPAIGLVSVSNIPYGEDEYGVGCEAFTAQAMCRCERLWKREDLWKSTAWKSIWVLWKGCEMKIDANPTAGILWDQLESAGIQDVMGVYNHSPYICVIAIKQKYASHAKQTGLAASHRES